MQPVSCGLDFLNSAALHLHLNGNKLKQCQCWFNITVELTRVFVLCYGLLACTVMVTASYYYT